MGRKRFDKNGFPIVRTKKLQNLEKYEAKMTRRQKDRDRIPLINKEWETFSLKEKDKIVSFKDDIIIVSIENANKGRKFRRKKKGGYRIY